MSLSLMGDVITPTSLPLLILDLDEALVYSTENEPNPRADFSFLHFWVKKRPYLDPLISTVSQWFELAVWTSSSAGYAHPTYEYYSSKNLHKVRRAGYPLERVLLIDDSVEKLSRHYGNYIRVRPFLGDPADAELRDLLPFLGWIREQANFRTIEKRNWRNFAPPVAE